ncbi:cyclic nucleotide-binding-like protein [Globomyces pollinis-pini]|nr:cyclic nucleotide-binding-like protein [Globomyces pollinis-pini]
MFTAGFGVNGPVENQDRWSKILNMIFSAFLLSLFTANITTYMIRLDSSGRQFNEKLEEVNQYIQYRGLGRGLQERIIQYYHFKYSKGKYFDEEKILAELNQPLRVSICMRECRALILQVPFFRDASHSFLTQVVTALEICHFLADDIIIEEGTAGDQMFFISSGFVHVLIGEKVFRTLTAGQYFGEISLLFGNMKRTATIVASTDCVVYSLSQADLDLILEFNPVMAKAMKDTAINRLKENKVKFEIPTEKSLPVQIIDQSFTRALPILADKKRPSLQIESVKIPVKEDSTEHKADQENDSGEDILEAAVEEAIQLSINNYKRRTSVQPFIDLSFINKVESNLPNDSNGSNDVLELQPNTKRSSIYFIC